MSSYELKPNEESFGVKAVGIRYRCEFCKEGEQIAVNDEAVVIQFAATKIGGPIMRKHRCNKCGKEMTLPKAYPYIEWIMEDANVST